MCAEPGGGPLRPQAGVASVICPQGVGEGGGVADLGVLCCICNLWVSHPQLWELGSTHSEGGKGKGEATATPLEHWGGGVFRLQM